MGTTMGGWYEEKFCNSLVWEEDVVKVVVRFDEARDSAAGGG